MRPVILIFPIVVIFIRQSANATTTTADRINSFGYGSETHNIVTKDGYGLTIFRIRKATRQETKNAPVVLLMHGLVSSSDCWVLRGLKDALAFKLVDNGYDVWLGNARGNPYGKRHMKMTIEDPSFWRFSFHEIGVVDLPTTIDYILQQTQQSSLHYVGHSQGTSIMFILLSMRPKYNKKFKSIHMFAPVAYLKNARSPLMAISKPLVGRHTPLDSLLGYVSSLFQPIVGQIFNSCQTLTTPISAICTILAGFINGGHSDYTQTSVMPEVFSTHPASASQHQSIHFIQLFASGRFCQYDFGVEGNQLRYNQSSPPDYRVKNIKPRFPFHFYYSDYDEFSTKTDVEKLSRLLGNRSVNHFVDLKNFVHFDFMWAYNIEEIINRNVLKIMNETEDILLRDNMDLLEGVGKIDEV